MKISVEIENASACHTRCRKSKSRQNSRLRIDQNACIAPVFQRLIEHIKRRVPTRFIVFN